MPPITVEALREKKKPKKDLYSQREKLESCRHALKRASAQLKTGKRKERELGTSLDTFSEAIFKVMQDPAVPENREKIEDGLDQLAELGDYLGAAAPGMDYSNVLDQILGAAIGTGDMKAQMDILGGFDAVNQVCELGIPMDRIIQGDVVQSTPQEVQKRKEFRAARLQQREDQKKKIQDYSL